MFNEKNVVRRTVNANIDTKNMEFMPLKAFVGRSLRVWGFFFTDTKYGKQCVAVTEGALINLPKRYVEQFEKFTEEEINAIINGGLVLSNIRVIDTNNGTTVTFDYADYNS